MSVTVVKTKVVIGDVLEFVNNDKMYENIIAQLEDLKVSIIINNVGGISNPNLDDHFTH